MSIVGLRLRHLTFFGPDLEPATISFEAGLNVVYGASNTGKSFIVDAIDFMLGGKGPLRDIPERIGYDRVILAMRRSMVRASQFSGAQVGELSGYLTVYFPKCHLRERGMSTQSSTATP